MANTTIVPTVGYTGQVTLTPATGTALTMTAANAEAFRQALGVVVDRALTEAASEVVRAAETH